ncbi:MAG TPA: GNAT family N-acetyltransferase [Pyrinomonadaceae bacterium]|jgi:GNAT superfamily N-acetyltransferase|nr:GNAT family N-acetyltransferase [Pyrinomonadaceae bacterium]
MQDLLKTVQILREDNHQNIDASIIRLSRDFAREKIDNTWWSLSETPEEAIQAEGDSHWKWEDIVLDYSDNSLYDCIALLSPEGYLEGAMAYQFNVESKLEKGKGSIYIGWLASAPHNRGWLVSRPQYRGIGTILLYWAVIESYNAGLEGRISLQSLPTASTIRFYESKGFVRTDSTQPAMGLVDYELPKSAASAWLKKTEIYHDKC